MAVDTAAKRFSMIDFGFGDNTSYPTGSMDVAQRLDFAGFYRGIFQYVGPLRIVASITQRARAQEVIIRKGDTNIATRKGNVTIQS